MKISEAPPPLYTVMMQLAGWTLDRTASIPKKVRFTFGQRLDNLALDCVEQVVGALYAPQAQVKTHHLAALSLGIERLRVLWRLVHDREWISQQQLLFVNQRLDEAGRMTGGWLKQVQGRRGS